MRLRRLPMVVLALLHGIAAHGAVAQTSVGVHQGVGGHASASAYASAGGHVVAGAPAGLIDRKSVARKHFGNDAPWFEENIPFLDIDDAEIERVYYYRWKLYRSHLREIGQQGVTVTEFLADVPWARHPYTDLNDSAAFHIREGRWLRNPAYVASLVDHVYAGGGNDRHFSEWLAAATLDFVKVTGDVAPAMRNLPVMEHVFELWDDHLDTARGLYWVEPIADATEYTISSIDASGAGLAEHASTDQNANGFTRGYAFRPSINSYQFANAEAIATFARMGNQRATAERFERRAEEIRSATLLQLWNPQLQHFTDVYQRSTATVKEGEFVRGRELVGYTPWMFHLVPEANATYDRAWSHALSPAELAGARGLRTVEPSYPRYLRQYRFDAETGRPECQWNGPSWPFQTSQTLTGMANLLHAAGAAGAGSGAGASGTGTTGTGGTRAVTRSDYLHLLRQYTHEHLLATGMPDLQEDYDPDTGAPIVGLSRSHHYNHSTYNDLILSGFIGVEARSDEVLEVNPLVPVEATSARRETGRGGGERPIRYFALEHLRYHGRDLSVVYDADGTRYHAGRGMRVWCNGGVIASAATLTRLTVPLCGKRAAGKSNTAEAALPRDAAVNVFEHAPSAFQTDVPIATASSTAAGSDAYQAIDGRLWFFPEIANGWSPAADDPAPTFQIDLRRPQRIDSAMLAFFADADRFAAPQSVMLQAETPEGWKTLATSSAAVANGPTELQFRAIESQRFRLVVQPGANHANRLIEIELFSSVRP